MLLGFDTLGRYGLLQFPAAGSAALMAARGLSSATGWAATFKFTQAAVSGSFAPTAVSAALNIKHAAGSVVFAVAGTPAIVRTTVSAGLGNCSANTVGGAFGVRHSLAAGSYGIAGGSQSFATSLASSGDSYFTAASNASFIRDFEAWIPRSFDSDDWSIRAIEKSTWNPNAGLPTGWSIQGNQPMPWTHADKQSETWDVE